LSDDPGANHMSLSIKTTFDRKNPPGKNSKAHLEQIKHLNPNMYHDCRTKNKLLDFTKFDCKEKTDTFDITFFNAYTPYVILGDKDKGE
jgi:hypothetical protein